MNKNVTLAQNGFVYAIATGRMCVCVYVCKALVVHGGGPDDDNDYISINIKLFAAIKCDVYHESIYIFPLSHTHSLWCLCVDFLHCLTVLS